MVFYLITRTGIAYCWDEGNPYLLEKQIIYDDFLPSGSKGRVSKVLVSAKLLSSEWDLLPVLESQRKSS